MTLYKGPLDYKVVGWKRRGIDEKLESSTKSGPRRNACFTDYGRCFAFLIAKVSQLVLLINKLIMAHMLWYLLDIQK